MTPTLRLLPLAALLALACAKESKPANPPAPEAKAAAAQPSPEAPSPAATARPAPPATGLQVARIVFVGKQEACECTRARIDASWSALQAAFGKKGSVPVERLNIDTQSEQVAFYQGLRAIMAVPALYFLDAKGGLVEMLQGEVSEEQALAALR